MIKIIMTAYTHKVMSIMRYKKGMYGLRIIMSVYLNYKIRVYLN